MSSGCSSTRRGWSGSPETSSKRSTTDPTATGGQRRDSRADPRVVSIPSDGVRVPRRSAHREALRATGRRMRRVHRVGRGGRRGAPGRGSLSGPRRCKAHRRERRRPRRRWPVRLRCARSADRRRRRDANLSRRPSRRSSVEGCRAASSVARAASSIKACAVARSPRSRAIRAIRQRSAWASECQRAGASIVPSRSRARATRSSRVARSVSASARPASSTSNIWMTASDAGPQVSARTSRASSATSAARSPRPSASRVRARVRSVNARSISRPGRSCAAAASSSRASASSKRPRCRSVSPSE